MQHKYSNSNDNKVNIICPPKTQYYESSLSEHSIKDFSDLCFDCTFASKKSSTPHSHLHADDNDDTSNKFSNRITNNVSNNVSNKIQEVDPYDSSSSYDEIQFDFEPYDFKLDDFFDDATFDDLYMFDDVPTSKEKSKDEENTRGSLPHKYQKNHDENNDINIPLYSMIKNKKIDDDVITIGKSFGDDIHIEKNVDDKESKMKRSNTHINKTKKFVISFNSKNGHPWAHYNKGQKSIYINGKNGPVIHLYKGYTYIFCVEENKEGHSFILTDLPNGGPSSRPLLNAFEPVSKGCVKFLVNDAIPRYLFYHDTKNEYAGGLVIVHDA